ncbi:transglycosylase SLT domain-containing protein [Fontimonas sp. SYSU GA230001]|uniref:transglycosylase SLT domain-containing protein n=1 Tax=Fontimonas sp. SYSU GA230001 TaxID=3142450 RepID=UPI0032B3BB2A
MIWSRLAAGMQLGCGGQPGAAQWAQRYARHPVAVERMLARSEPWLWHIVEAAERRRMPLELALLPAVESGFDAAADSPRRARGIWQLVPVTAHRFSLAQTSAYDARRDPIASTRAALGHLSDLHEQFGDWWLAIAAFNLGPGALAKTLREQPQARTVWDLRLPRETSDYVRKLAGLCLLIENPDRYGLSLPPIADRPATELVRLRQAIDLASAARHANIDEALIFELNPGLRELGNTHGKDQLVLPSAAAARLRSVLAQHEFPPQPLTTFKTHVVAPGESLWHIARRYNTSIATLALSNGLSADAVIRPGRRLQVPVGT